ncbi:glycosyltransferase family 2 protein [Chryseobacterium lactis]|uniref:Glycosyltransferase family 2 protein n=1 Tax=Chryseobacterium lactis TaxID=1241981 RepID=A0A3G6RND4_CHRLC|nr:glycosyltransferase family 2 protein [Chryseobacterium lactis]AZA81416.1 glycosyltransferase family 2 protein [Chryseobacterium lactis]AZB06415.1 glycosyltransferase family 2 protein [Chryseobacterium lactis]PNW15267.1 glycosyltransferase family 2 protein [Chryseobacterium lactis]
MKLSICIPVYNFDVRELVFDLKKEIKAYHIDAEIILIDDASKEHYKQINQPLQNEVFNFIFLEKNIGRSRIRNLFLQFSTGQYLLFLDCDGKIVNTNFLRQYIQFILENPSATVIYGGRKVSELNPDQDHYLRWKFAVERENLPVELRKEKPFLSFQTNNFMIRKEVLGKVGFNPEFQKYGYEDLLFAMDLKAENVKIDHIDNPILNNDLESNIVYIGKVEESVDSLSNMLKDQHLSLKLSEVKLVKMYYKFKKMPFNAVFSFLFTMGEGSVKRKLTKGNVSLRYLDIYKLGLLLRMMK